MQTFSRLVLWALVGLAFLQLVLATPQRVTPPPPQAIKRHVRAGSAKRWKQDSINNPLIASLQVKADILRKPPQKAKRACPSLLPNGNCACTYPGQTYCPAVDSCTDLDSDASNCGTCGNVCPLYGLCSSGTCTCDEANGFLPCYDGCYDSNNGGTCCDNAAGLYECVVGYCTDVLGNDASNCGKCAQTCPTYALCSGGTCTCDEANGFLPCNAVCYDPNSGICCDNADGLYECTPGTCTDVMASDTDNCGACGTVCPEDALCSDGVCGCDEANNYFTCIYGGCYDANDGGVCCDNADNLYDCGAGTCTDVMASDTNNCGACGTVCPQGALCTDGVCGCDAANGFQSCFDQCYSPAAGQICCYNAIGSYQCSGEPFCTDTQGFDTNNCGGCGIICPYGTHCMDGMCG